MIGRLSPNARTASFAALIAVAMTGLGFAAVPLYDLFCRTTGFGGAVREATAAPGKVLQRSVTIRYNADTDPALDWSFHAGEKPVSIHVGEQHLTHFKAVNRGGTPVTGTAVYNVTPHAAGPYFNKIECFCFERQTLTPGQEATFPVSFFIDPAFADDPALARVDTITLSYTFFPAPEGAVPLARASR